MWRHSEALADAAFPEDPAARARTGVIVAMASAASSRSKTRCSRSRPIKPWDRILAVLRADDDVECGGPRTSRWRTVCAVRSFPVASACASSNDAFAVAFDKIALGQATAVVTGGSEATVMPTAMGGFDSMKALSRHNSEPEKASRPFDLERDGFVLGEGSAVLVLEEREFALARGARIYAEVLGYGQSADAFHIAQPDPASQGVILAMERALENSGITKEQVGYINAHGTSTPLGDLAESQAIETVFGEHAYKLAVSSTKSMHGHLLGAAGAVEGAACALALYHGILPPTINYERPDPECRLDYVPNVAREAQVDVAMSNGFGFGGHNSTVVFARHVDPA